jgi:hypothetical protein
MFYVLTVYDQLEGLSTESPRKSTRRSTTILSMIKHLKVITARPRMITRVKRMITRVQKIITKVKRIITRVLRMIPACQGKPVFSFLLIILILIIPDL